MRDQLEQKLEQGAREKSLADFYRQAPSESVGTELGRYYLSFLQSACEKQNVRIESIVSQPARSDLTVIRLFPAVLTRLVPPGRSGARQSRVRPR